MINKLDRREVRWAAILSLFVVEHLFPQTISACSTICHYDSEMFAPFILLPTVGYRHLGVRIMGYIGVGFHSLKPRIKKCTWLSLSNKVTHSLKNNTYGLLPDYSLIQTPPAKFLRAVVMGLSQSNPIYLTMNFNSLYKNIQQSFRIT